MALPSNTRTFAAIEVAVDAASTRTSWEREVKQAISAAAQFIGDVVSPTSTDYTCTDRQNFILGTTGNADRTITLLDPSVNRVVEAIKIDSGTGKLILYTPSGDIVFGNGSTTAHHELVAQGASVRLRSNGTNYYILS